MFEQFSARRVLRLFILTLVLGALLVPLTVAAPVRAETRAPADTAAQTFAPFAAPKKVASIFGLDDGGVLHSSDMTLDLAAETGVKWVRIAVEWDSVEAVRGTYDFTQLDKVLNPMIAKGFTPMAFLADNPSWAANTHCGPIDTRDASLMTSFKNLMGTLAARYPVVKVWALYNEVDFDGTPESHNGGCFGSRTPGGVNNNGKRDVDEYATLLAAAWKAVHAANPKALVATGALAFDNFNEATAPSGYPGAGIGGSFNYDFLTDLTNTMKNNPRPAGEKFMDMLLFNYYDLYGTWYWKNVASGEGVQAKASVLRQRLAQANLKGVKLFVSETGSESYSNGVDGQARCLTLNLVRGAAAKLKGVIWWTFKDFDDTSAQPTWKYGIVDQNYQRKLAHSALKTLVTELNNYKYNGTLSGQTDFQDIEAYRFASGGKFKYLVLSSSIASQAKRSNCVWDRNTRLVKFDANSLRVVTYIGKAKTVRDNSKKDLDPAVGRIAIKAGANPQIVQINP